MRRHHRETARFPNRKSQLRLWLFASILIPAMNASAGELYGRASVIDGDSLRIDDYELRLHGIDAPEFRQTCVREGVAEPCGIRAKNALTQMVGSNNVRCTWTERDSYGRLLATCYVEGENLNARLVAAGLALAYTRYSTRYEPEQRQARSAGRGVWSTVFSPPWQWRREQPR